MGTHRWQSIVNSIEICGFDKFVNSRGNPATGHANFCDGHILTLGGEEELCNHVRNAKDHKDGIARGDLELCRYPGVQQYQH